MYRWQYSWYQKLERSVTDLQRHPIAVPALGLPIGEHLFLSKQYETKHDLNAASNLIYQD